MTEEDFIELLLDQGIHVGFFKGKIEPLAIHPGDYYMVSLFGWNIQEFGTAEGAEKFRQTLKERSKKDMLNTLNNKRLSDALDKEHQNHETTIAIERQKKLMGK